MAAKIKKGDKVVVIAGRDKGRSGEVIEMRRDDGRLLVRGVNMVKLHQRQTAQQEGGIISKEAPIHLSNVALADPHVDDDLVEPRHLIAVLVTKFFGELASDRLVELHFQPRRHPRLRLARRLGLVRLRALRGLVAFLAFAGLLGALGLVGFVRPDRLIAAGRLLFR